MLATKSELCMEYWLDWIWTIQPQTQTKKFSVVLEQVKESSIVYVNKWLHRWIWSYLYLDFHAEFRFCDAFEMYNKSERKKDYLLFVST